MDLASLLEISPGVTAVIGGGGKTTLLRTLGEELAGRGHGVLLCTTTKMLPFPDIPLALDKASLAELARTHRLVSAGTLLPDSGKLTAPPAAMEELAALFSYILVEADGAARRPLKAHAPHEPVIPPQANQTILVAGASGFGRPIRESVHRPEIYAALAGVSQEDLASPETEAAAAGREALHDRIYVNQVETGEALDLARRLAELAGCPVVAGSLREGVYAPC
ncbi:MAG: putative selenium-dependent hydroxylase accessory protein YqeC [Oscillibacter sp.]|nr:putative selenium-dependent hydroxylase accessory protein YqeC [Oscillibacter sp.]